MTWVQSLDRDDIIDHIQNVAEVLGKTPTSREFIDRVDYSHHVVNDRFGCWSNALGAAGFEPIGPGAKVKVPTEQIIEDIRRATESLGRRPTILEFDETVEYSGQLAHVRFGSWNEALEEADV